MAERAPNQIGTPEPHRLDAPAFVVGQEDLVTAARSLRSIALELAAMAARVKNAAPAKPALGKFPGGERCTVEEWAAAAFLGVAGDFRKLAREAIQQERAVRRSKVLRAARAK